MRTARLAGATGFPGAEVARQLAGYRVRVWAPLRPASDGGRRPVAVEERMPGHDVDATCLREAMAGVDVVLHLGARVAASSATELGWHAKRAFGPPR